MSPPLDPLLCTLILIHSSLSWTVTKSSITCIELGFGQAEWFNDDYDTTCGGPWVHAWE